MKIVTFLCKGVLGIIFKFNPVKYPYLDDSKKFCFLLDRFVSREKSLRANPPGFILGIPLELVLSAGCDKEKEIFILV